MSPRTLLALLALLLAGGMGLAPAHHHQTTSAMAALPTLPTLPEAFATALPRTAVVPPTTTTPLPRPFLPTPPDSRAVLDTAQQARALLPAHASDLAQAGNWHHYAIDAQLNPQQQTIRGHLRVRARNTSAVALDALYFHLYPNHADTLGSMWVSDEALVDGQAVAVATEQDDLLLRVPLLRPLAPGDTALVEMDFRARTPRNRSHAAYGAFNMEDGVWALATCYPVLAYLFDTGWDLRAVDSRGDYTVTQAALYDVVLEVPDAWHLVASGTRIDTTDDTPAAAPGMRRERFVSGPQRDFFIAAVQGLLPHSTSVDGTTIVSYARPEHAAGGALARDVAALALHAYNTRYGAYPYTELEVLPAALTTFHGVEYPGVVLIEQSAYANPYADDDLLGITVAHEVSHQWWYNIVGNDTKGQAWLDEGLASYSEIVYYEAVGNPARAADTLQYFRDLYLNARSAGRDGVVNRHTSDMGRSYYALAYGKSALFFAALRARMGDEAFFAMLQGYTAAHRYGEASGDDLVALAEEHCACSVRPLYEAWILGASPVALP